MLMTVVRGKSHDRPHTPKMGQSSASINSVVRGKSHDRPHTLRLLSGFLLLLSALFILSGCGASSNQQSVSPGPWPGPVAVTFVTSVSYATALRLLTDLGLQPALNCTIGSTMITPGLGSTGMPQVKWEPVGQQIQYAEKHQLLVMPAYLSPPTNWQERLQATPEVSKVGFLDPPQYLCDPSVLVYGTPPAGTPFPLTAHDPLQYAHVAFHPQVSYDTALSVISNEGLRLADPCYDQAEQKGKGAWHPMGQAGEFAITHTLLVATNKGITSNLWQQQLRTLPDITSLTMLSGCEH